jgi:hypothetical protein
MVMYDQEAKQADGTTRLTTDEYDFLAFVDRW